MSLKQMAAYKRDDYKYESPDGEAYEITIIQTVDRKYVEIKRDKEAGSVSWDVEMLLDIADAVRATVQKPATPKTHALQKPKVSDRRSEELSPAEAIQASVAKSLGQMEQTDAIEPVQSFSPDHMQKDVEERLNRPRGGVAANPKAGIKRTK